MTGIGFDALDELFAPGARHRIEEVQRLRTTAVIIGSGGRRFVVELPAATAQDPVPELPPWAELPPP